MLDWALAARNQEEYTSRKQVLKRLGFSVSRGKLNLEEPLAEIYRLKDLQNDDQVAVYFAAFIRNQQEKLERAANHTVDLNSIHTFDEYRGGANFTLRAFYINLLLCRDRSKKALI